MFHSVNSFDDSIKLQKSFAAGHTLVAKAALVQNIVKETKENHSYTELSSSNRGESLSPIFQRVITLRRVDLWKKSTLLTTDLKWPIPPLTASENPLIHSVNYWRRFGEWSKDVEFSDFHMNTFLSLHVNLFTVVKLSPRTVLSYQALLLAFNLSLEEKELSLLARSHPDFQECIDPQWDFNKVLELLSVQRFKNQLFWTSSPRLSLL